MAADSSSRVPGTDASDPVADTSKLLPVSLDLESSTANFVDGKWVVKGPVLQTEAPQEEVAALMQRIRTLEEHGIEYERRLKELSDANAMLAFKHKLMLEMLAVAQLDGETAARMLGDERLRTEALKWELARQALSDARVMAEGPLPGNRGASGSAVAGESGKGGAGRGKGQAAASDRAGV